jgi:Protein of unknown function (DUF3034).
MDKRLVKASACAALTFAFAVPSSSQSLNWEGQTGAFITPFAYTSPSDKGKVGKPSVAYHYLSGGDVIGDNHQASITVGMLGRAEFGYTRTFTKTGNTPGLSSLFGGGFNTFHGKVNVVRENAGKSKWVPAISTGFVARTNVRRAGGRIVGEDTVNGDVYVVATKTITAIKELPIVVNAGYKATNASLMGLAGNASAWQGRAFGAVAVVLPGPAKSKLIVGSEFAQQPRHLKDLPGVSIPTSMTYFVRILPRPEKPFNIDFGIAQAAGNIAPGVNVRARNRFAMGVSYRF